MPIRYKDLITQDELLQLEIEDNKDKLLYTSEDIVGLMEYFKNNNKYSIIGLIDYFNNKLEFNKIAELLQTIISDGIPLLPQVMFRPVTEKCTIVDNSFVLTDIPYEMAGYYFLNNLVVVKHDDGSYDFFDDVRVDIETKTCYFQVEEEVQGVATVSYFVVVTDTIGGE